MPFTPQSISKTILITKSCDCNNKEQKVIGGIVLWNLLIKIPSVEAYNQLRVNAGMNSTKPLSEVKKALEGTLFLVSVL